MNQEMPAERPIFKVRNGLALVVRITSYILVPLILIGGLGFWLDRLLGGHNIIFLVMMVLAFIISNHLVYKKAKEINKRYR